MAQQTQRARQVPSAIVAVAAWIVPGAGYLLIGDIARGLTVGITIVLLFFGGLLVGGIRCLDVPGYDAHGTKIMVSANGRPGPRSTGEAWILQARPLDEIRSKPWSIPQIMMGPVDVICDIWSVRDSQPAELGKVDADGEDSSGASYGEGERIAARSHARLNDQGVLYTAVAGLLNLLAIIDSAHRAAHQEAQ